LAYWSNYLGSSWDLDFGQNGSMTVTDLGTVYFSLDQFKVIPEPNSFVLLGLGLAAGALVIRRKQLRSA